MANDISYQTVYVVEDVGISNEVRNPISIGFASIDISRIEYSKSKVKAVFGNKDRAYEFAMSKNIKRFVQNHFADLVRIFRINFTERQLDYYKLDPMEHAGKECNSIIAFLMRDEGELTIDKKADVEYEDIKRIVELMSRVKSLDEKHDAFNQLYHVGIAHGPKYIVTQRIIR